MNEWMGFEFCTSTFIHCIGDVELKFIGYFIYANQFMAQRLNLSFSAIYDA